MSKKEAESKKIIETKGPLIYCGPNFTGELQQFSIFKEGIPDHIKTYIEKCPEIKRMFYPTSKLIKVRNKIKEQGSKENQMYIKILEFQKEVN